MDKLTILKNSHFMAGGGNYYDGYTIIRSSYPIYIETSPNASSYVDALYDVFSYNNGVKTYMKIDKSVEDYNSTSVRLGSFSNTIKPVIDYTKPQYRRYSFCILQ